MSEGDVTEDESANLEVALAALRRDYSKLLPRVRTLEHTVACECDSVVLRLHFPALRQGKATVPELIDAIVHFMVPFALPRAEINEVDALFTPGNLDEFKFRYSELSERAKALFKRANEATNRNGEAGELLLYLLTEWMLEAPQLVAKMSLKTNREMPVHGSDGIHVRYAPDQGRLLLFWGESKLYADVDVAISAAITSITEALEPEKLKHEIELVQRNISFAGLDDASKSALLKYLDPYDDASNLVYANGAAEAEKIAVQLADLFSHREPTEEQLALAELAREAVHPNYVLVECVKRGVGFHYSNIPTQLRRAVEAAVSAGHLDYLVCTSTLLQGVNLPAKNIFMFAPEKGKTNPLESTDFWNLSGRAGRLRREFQGNIFLIDYAKWKKQPLDGPKDSVVVPAIESSVRNREQQLVTVITDQAATARRDQLDLETTFGRLYSDHKRGTLPTTLGRIGISRDAPEAKALTDALTAAETMVSIPAEILRRTPNISAHKQQRLFNHLQAIIDQGADSAKTLIPSHPRESEAFQSYADILELCYDIILGIDTSKNLHRFHALLALKWMRGVPLPQIIDEQINRAKAKPPQTTIRETLNLIETDIRFQAVRLFGCYNALLVYAFDSAGMIDLVSSIPSVPLYLEVGASDKTMISFIALGLSRVTAMKLNDLSARKDLDVPAALQWLRARAPESLGLSPLLLSEVRLITAA